MRDLFFAAMALLFFFPILRMDLTEGVFGLVITGTLGYILFNVIAPWFQQRQVGKAGPSLRFNIFVATVLGLGIIIALIMYFWFGDLIKYKLPNALEGHSTQINTLVFDASTGTKLASGGMDGILRVWNAPRNDLSTRLLPADTPIYSKYQYRFTALAYHPKGTLIAGGSNDHSVRIWNTQDESLVSQLYCHLDDVQVLAFSNDGQYLASGGQDKQICIWRVDTWTLIKRLGEREGGHSEPIIGLAFSPDGRYLATAANDRNVKIWLTGDWTLQFTGKKHTDNIRGIAFSKESNVIISVTDQHSVRRWNFVDQTTAELYKDKPAAVTAVAFNRDATVVAIANYDRTIRLYDTNPANPVLALSDKFKLETEKQKETITALLFEPTGERLAFLTNPHLLKLWDIKTNKEIKSTDQLGNELQGLVYHPSNPIIASSNSDKTIRFWQTDRAEVQSTIDGEREEIILLAFTRDANYVASASSKGTVRVWRMDDPTLQREYAWKPETISALTINPSDNTIVAMGTAKGQLRIVNGAGAPAEIKAYEDAVTSLAFSGNGRYLLTGGIDHPIGVWGLDGKHLTDLANQNGRINHLIFSSDGKTLAATSSNRTTVLFKFADPAFMTATVPVTLPVTADVVASLAFSKDSQSFATAYSNGVVQIWNVADGQLLETLPGRAPAQAIGIDKEDRIWVAGITSGKPNIQIWQAGNIKEARNLFSFEWWQKYLIGTEVGRIFWSIFLGFAGALFIQLSRVWGTSAVAARAMYTQYPGFSYRQAWRTMASIELGIYKIEQLVKKGEIQTIRGAVGQLAALGGPGVAIVEEGNVAILMQSGRLTRIVGMGITWLEHFERVHMAVPLNGQSEKVVLTDLPTLDGMILSQVEFSVRYRVDPGAMTSTSGIAFPYDGNLIREKIWSPEGGNWKWNPRNAVEPAARDLIAQFRFEDVLAISGSTRQELLNDIEKRVSVRGQNAGVQVLGVALGAVRMPDEVKQVLETKNLAELKRQTAVIEAEAKKEMRAREGEGEALAFRLKEKERNVMREQLLRELIAPLQTTGGNTGPGEEIARRYVTALEHFIEILDQVQTREDSDLLRLLWEREQWSHRTPKSPENRNGHLGRDDQNSD